jgi:glyoxylase-like metal-dependent hydrolase (beta-lactamase superfamily II)
MILEVRAVPPFMKNGYVLGCERTHEAVLVDPGDDVDLLLGAVTERELDVQRILLTHAHLDHISGVATARAALDAPVYLHRDDLPLYERVVEQGQMFGIAMSVQPAPDEFYDAEPLHFGDYTVRVHHTPGHSPGGVTLQIGLKESIGSLTGETHLFVGDALFAGTIGRTDLPGGNYSVLMRSITEVILPLGDTAIVHPGHGPDTTIQRERTGNPFILEYLEAR